VEKLPEYCLKRVEFNNNFQFEANNLRRIAYVLAAKYKPTIRQQERIFSLARLVLCSFHANEYTFSDILFILIYIKILKTDLYKKIDKGELEIQELSDLFGNLMITDDIDNNRGFLGHTEAQLLWFYNNNQKPEKRAKLIIRVNGLQPSTAVKSKLLTYANTLTPYFESIEKQRYSSFGLDYILKKINLTEPIVTL
jgi:hypothetical protein